MNVLIFFIFPLNKEGLATFTLAPSFCYNIVVTCCCRPVIRVRSCSSQMEGAWDVEAVDCSVDCCWCCQNICNSSGDSNDDDVSLYKDKWSSLSELMISY